MRLTFFTDYGLRTVMRLAADPRRLFTIGELAQEFDISRNHLAKIIRELASAGIVATQRGPSGGFRLARAPEDITLGEVVRILEARTALVECFRAGGNICVLEAGCRLKGRLASAREAFLRELDGTTLAECSWRPGQRISRTAAA